MKFGTFRRAAIVLAGSFLSVVAVAQTAGDQPRQGGLAIPSDVSFVGPAEQNVARATAIVNDEIITQTDVEQRMALMLASQRVQLSAEEQQRLRAQILRNLIDETLQIQAARENEMAVEQREIDQYYARFAQGFGHTPQTFGDYLRTIGSSERSVKRQITGELSWQRLQRYRMTRVSVADEEVRQVLDRLNASRGSSEYRVGEIYVSATPETAATVRSNLARIVEQIRGGASFPAYARQYSEATTAALGGDLGWVRPEQLPPELASVVQAMPVQAVTDPIQVSGGFSVIYLVDSRQVLVADPRDAVLSLMQMSIDLPAGTTEPQARARADQLAEATRSMGGCGRAPDVARTIGAELVSNDGMRARELPVQLQQMLLDMSVGQATQPFGTTERISVLVLCGRDDPRQINMPTAEDVQTALAEQRMNQQAQRYLRDLRRDAVIEYR